MEEIGLTTYVDSCVWGCAGELLRKIDNKFCVPQGWKKLQLQLRNRTAANVHFILSVTLQKMINRSELFLFLGTDIAIKIDDYMSGEGRLASPWIFSEMMFAKNVKRSARKTYSKSNEIFEIKGSQRSLPEVAFRFDISKLKQKIEFDRLWLG